MIVDLWQRGRRDILEARVANRLPTDERHIDLLSDEVMLEPGSPLAGSIRWAYTNGTGA